VIYVDENGRPLTPTTREMVEEYHSTGDSKDKSEQIDTRHLYAVRLLIISVDSKLK